MTEDRKKIPSGLVSGSVLVTTARVVSAACAFVLLWFISQESVAQLGAFRTLFVFFLVVEFLEQLHLCKMLHSRQMVKYMVLLMKQTAV